MSLAPFDSQFVTQNSKWRLGIQLDGCPGTTCRACVTLSFDLDFGPTWTNLWNGTSTHDGKQLCKLILKSIQIVGVMVQTKNVTLTLGLPEWMFQMAHLHVVKKQLCQIILKSIHKCRSYDPDKIGRTQAHMYILRTVTVITMSRSPQEGSTIKIGLWICAQHSAGSIP